MTCGSLYKHTPVCFADMQQRLVDHIYISWLTLFDFIVFSMTCVLMQELDSLKKLFCFGEKILINTLFCFFDTSEIVIPNSLSIEVLFYFWQLNIYVYKYNSNVVYGPFLFAFF